jgi:uncharacterized protein (DUF58 family)
MQAGTMGWLDRIAPRLRLRRGPHAGDYRIEPRGLYILPTRAGLLFGAMLLVMLVTAINYQLALGYALTFLLVGVGLVSMIQTWRNLLGITLRPGRAEPVHAGEFAELGLMLQIASGPERFALELHVPGNAQPTPIDLTPGAERLVNVALATEHRGWLAAPRMRLESTWPLGLWCAWTWWHPQQRLLVLPRLETPGMPLPPADSEGSDLQGRSRGDDDFAAIRPFRAGDSPRRLAWKAMARTGADTLLIREFEGGSGGLLWLDFSSLPHGLSVEERLSRLARWVNDAELAGLRYGLRLPSGSVDPDLGPAHRAECMRRLALAPA